MDINLQKCMAFMKTVEYGSFTKAAELLNYSQSGISRMIHDLEKIWNVSLLERGRTGDFCECRRALRLKLFFCGKRSAAGSAARNPAACRTRFISVAGVV